MKPCIQNISNLSSKMFMGFYFRMCREKGKIKGVNLLNRRFSLCNYAIILLIRTNKPDNKRSDLRSSPFPIIYMHAETFYRYREMSGVLSSRSYKEESLFSTSFLYYVFLFVFYISSFFVFFSQTFCLSSSISFYS